MLIRNLSPMKMFIDIANEHKPVMSFKGKNKRDFESWKNKTYPEIIKTLGDFPKEVPPNPELVVRWEHDGLIKERWLIDVGKHISASFQINFPKNIKRGEKRRAILCWHGHGPFGKEPVMGNDSSAEMRQQISSMNYNYGHIMAKEGFITFGIDWIGAGERKDSKTAVGGRDWCNVLYLNATLFGMTSLSINLTHGKLATDFACTFKNVDKNRLGVMGLSGGGTMTLFTSLFDKRIKATEIICYSTTYANYAMEDLNTCGMQTAPGLYKYVDVGDLQGLIAPKPLLVDIGAKDDCFPADDAMQCFKKVKYIYNAAGVPDKLYIDLFPGNHGWGGNKSKEFFTKYL